MGATAINYDALAQQHGGGVDYDAIASQHGASTTPPKEGFFHSLAAQFGVTPEQIQGEQDERNAHPAKSFLKDLAGPAGSVLEGLYNQGKLTVSEIKAAHDASVGGNRWEGLHHLVQAVPIVGPAINKAADQAPATTGNYVKDVANVATDPGAMGTLVGAAANAAPLVAGAVDSAVPNRPVIQNPAVVRPLVKAAGKVALLGKTPEAAYESALKPSVLVSQADRDALVKTGLDNALPISKGGVEKLGDLINKLNNEISDTIGKDPSRPIDTNAVASRADDAKFKFQRQVNAGKDLKAIEDSKQQFLNEQGGAPGTPAPPMRAIDAQEMKQGTYQILAGKYGELSTASLEAQKALARGLKEEIASQFPEISTLNANESRLLDFQPILERAVNRISNHQIIGIGTPAAGAAAKAVTSSNMAGQVAMVMKAVLDNPNVKSRLAIMVSKAQKVPISVARNRVSAYSTGLAATAVGSRGYSSDDNPNPPTTPQP